MRVIASLLAVVVLAVLVAIVAGGIALAQAVAVPPSPLAGSEWRPVEIRTEAIDSETSLYVRFAADGKVSGTAAATGSLATYKIAGANLAFSPLATTRKACPEPLMKLEGRFLTALEETRAFERDKTRLVLRNGAGETMMRLAQTDWD